MDSVSAVGLTASVAQFVDIGARTITGTITLLKDVKDTPQWIRNLLSDVQKSIEYISLLQQAVEQSGSENLVRPDHALSRGTVAKIEDAHGAMTDLKDTLRPYSQDLPSSAQGGWKKTWNAAMSLTERSTIEQKIQRVFLLNHEVSQGLQLIQLEAQKKILQRLQRVGSSVESDRQALSTQFDCLKSISEQIQQDAHSFKSDIGNLQLQAASTGACITEIDRHFEDVTIAVNSVGDSTKRLEASFLASSNDLKMEQIQLRNSVDNTRDEFQRIGDDIKQLRDHILPWLVGSRVAFVSPDEPTTSLLCSTENSNLRIELARKLAESPGGFRRAWDNTIYGLQTGKGINRLRQLQVHHSCICKPGLSRKISRKGMFSLAFESGADHLPECRCYTRRKKTWRYTLAAHLLPILGRTLSITFARTSGAGGCSMGIFLNHYRTVKRSESDLFMLFDHFPEKLTQEKLTTRVISVVYEGRIVFQKTPTVIDYELITFRDSENEIEGFSRSLIQLLHQGLGWDKDEYGNTVLHELAHLILFLGLAPSRAYAQLQNLIEMVLAAGVDVFAPSKAGDYRPYLPFNLWVGQSFTKAFTVPEIVVNCAVVFPEVFDKIPFYDIIGEHSFNEAGRIYKDLVNDGEYLYAVSMFFKVPADREVSRHQSVLRVLHHHPDLTTMFGYGPFENSILTRSKDRMLQILTTQEALSRNCKESGLYPLDFALGWPDGLLLLLEAGYPAAPTLQLSISIGDTESTKILLEAESFSLAKHPLILLQASESNSLDIQRSTILEIKKSRECLRSIALEHLSDKEIGDLELSQDQFLDSRLDGVWNALIKKGIKPPAKSHPGHAPTIYFFVGTDCQVRFLDALYDAGFVDVDGSYQYCGTPLLKLLHSRVWETSNGLSLVRWFMDKQASVNFTAEESFPTILFYFAIAYSNFVKRTPSKDQRSFLEELAPVGTSLCEPLHEDGCSCYCSIGGCLPSHKIWICNPETESHVGCRSLTRTLLDSSLKDWVQLCLLDSAQTLQYYKSTCRVEIFHRLGMAHTCCTYLDTHKVLKNTMEKDQQRQLQDEDSELLEQLELLMEAYEKLQREYDGPFLSFWAQWWLRVDEILPELSPEERCRCKGLDRSGKDFTTLLEEKVKWLSQHRTEMERDVLKKNGYCGMHFVDVIQQQFADCLSPKS